MGRIAFADESGTDGNSRCYAIGVLSFEQRHRRTFEAEFERLRQVHKIRSEVHWTKVGNSCGIINFILDWFDLLLRSATGRFDCIVVNTSDYRQWSRRGADREAAFYKTYTFLLNHMARQVGAPSRVLIDDRNDRYSKHHEVVETVANHMLRRSAERGTLDVERVASREEPGVQLADVLTGALQASHRRSLGDPRTVNRGKSLAIARLAARIGWADLCHDTLPDSKFNVWHFPKEYRGPTRKVRPRSTPVPHVTRGELNNVPDEAR